jgi:adenylate kinase family enzyme
MCSTILLIGPLCAGKSTVGQLLAERLNLPHCSVDTLPLEYFTELGLDMQRIELLRETQGWLVAYRYMLEFGVRVVEQLLAEQRRRVIDFGAPYSTYEDDSLLGRVKRAFAPYQNVVLLLPSPDLDESTKILKKRMVERKGHTKLRRWLMGLHDETGIDYEELYVKHHSNFQLAQVVIYTEGKSPEQTRDEIIEVLNL